MTALDFTGKTVAVSGAAIGFGRAIARMFRDHGATVHGCDIRPETQEALAAEGMHGQRVDLTNRAAAAAWIRGVEAAAGGPIDVLVCNAGGVAGQAMKPLESVADEEFDRVVEINLGSAFSLCRAAAPAMKAAGRGAIVTITSGAALQASLTGVQAYCASKHALLGLTRQMAHEFGPHGIRVNSVAPGFVRTNEATERQWASYSPEKQRQIVENVALKRLGTAEEIAKAVLFLASDLASFVNGQILSVDGGK
ncbi:SDR family NAD(P)-dependent oxidoreductase [Teichococcus wenyumeiae]|uniref:SDR family NAD(P)-dependent oxidoreductase n=1 Tax=Teichococcus wenyumeiae TaxID=2478470 RepID=UPI001F3C2B01|nr:SDR family NAD(P)-dependent oxidoreductase [Pseudoroseomonas wenyumeiae]